MSPADDVVWWTAFGALAQAIGAIATFSAVVVSLWIALSERKVKATVQAAIYTMFAGDGSPGVDMIGISVTNTGLRPFQVAGVGWETGWLRRGPRPLLIRQAIQNTEKTFSGKMPPYIVEPLSHEGIYTLVENWKMNHQDGRSASLFSRRIPILGYAPIWAVVHITGSKPIRVRAAGNLADFLRTGVYG